jgi:hypothetical protein
MKKKKSRGFSEIVISGEGGVSLFEGVLNDLDFPETLIIAKSIYFFHDEAPCFIHRSAVVSRLASELELMLEQNPDLSIEQAEEACPGYFAEYPGASRIRIRIPAGTDPQGLRSGKT